MATFYVRSTDGNDADTGATWALAKSTLAGALAAAAAGDRIWVSQSHAESTGANVSLASPGTAASPVEILCGNDAAEPPVAWATSASVSTTGTGTIGFSGHGTYRGLTFNAGSGGSASAINFNSASTAWTRFEQSQLILRGTGSSGRIKMGTESTLAADQRVELYDSNVQVNNAASAINACCKFEWRGGSLTLGATPTGGLIKPLAGTSTQALISGVDLSVLGANALVGIGTGTPAGLVEVRNCKFSATPTATTGTNPGPGQCHVWLDNCDSADTQDMMTRHRYEGDTTTESTNVLSGGASNGVRGISYRMVSAAGATFAHPHYSPELAQWNTSTGSPVTVTVEILHDNTTTLTDRAIWLEVEVLDGTDVPKSNWYTDKCDQIGTPAPQTSSVGTAWTTTGLTNPTKQKLAVSVTPMEIGLIRARVALATPSYTVYVDPLLTVA